MRVDAGCRIGERLERVDAQAPGTGVAGGIERGERGRARDVRDPLPRQERPRRCDRPHHGSDVVIGNGDDDQLGIGGRRRSRRGRAPPGGSA